MKIVIMEKKMKERAINLKNTDHDKLKIMIDMYFEQLKYKKKTKGDIVTYKRKYSKCGVWTFSYKIEGTMINLSSYVQNKKNIDYMEEQDIWTQKEEKPYKADFQKISDTLVENIQKLVNGKTHAEDCEAPQLEGLGTAYSPSGFIDDEGAIACLIVSLIWSCRRIYAIMKCMSGNEYVLNMVTSILYTLFVPFTIYTLIKSDLRGYVPLLVLLYVVSSGMMLNYYWS